MRRAPATADLPVMLRPKNQGMIKMSLRRLNTSKRANLEQDSETWLGWFMANSRVNRTAEIANMHNTTDFYTQTMK